MLPAPAAGSTTPFRPSGDGNPPLHATRGKTLKKLSRILALTAALVGAASTAHAQFAKPEDAIKYRQSAYTVLSTHFGRIGAMVNGRIPFDPKVAEGDAAIALVASRLPMAASCARSARVPAKRPPRKAFSCARARARRWFHPRLAKLPTPVCLEATAKS